MRAMSSKRSGRVLVLALSLSSLTTLVQAEVVGQASASVTSFGFTVKDLRPDDGIAPSFTVNHPWRYDAGTSVLKYQETSKGSLNILESDSMFDARSGSDTVNVFHPEPLTVNLPSGDAHAAVTQGALSTTVTLNSADFVGANYGWYQYGNWLNNYESGLIVGGPQVKADASTGFERWILSPGSEVTVSGTIKLNAFVNAQAVSDLAPGEQVLAAAMATAYANFYSSYQGWGNIEIIKSLPNDDPYSVLKVRELASDTLGSLGRDHAQSSMEQSFSYTIRNVGVENVDMYFGVSVMARAGATPVPEPSTWAMALLGLGLIAVFSRRRSEGPHLQ